jgi:GDP-4-dehydro-6-deoxy-D-mannose reductase
MKKILITGTSGFVGGHFIHHILSGSGEFEIYGVSRSKPAWDFIPRVSDILCHHQFYEADLMDADSTKSLVKEIDPDYVLHLAAQSSVAASWSAPAASFTQNTKIFLNLMEAFRSTDTDAKILSVGSSEQYGNASQLDLPLSEDKPMCPSNPYAVARVAQEQLAMVYANGYGLDICCTRSFNHCGPGQTEQFVIGSIVRQFALIRHGKQEPVIHLRNGSVVRDFLDVRDVVNAYNILLMRGKRGGVYNVCSGKGRKIRDIVVMLSHMSGIIVDIKEELHQLRPMDNQCIIGSNTKIQSEFDWYPKISFEDTLRSMYDYRYKCLKHEIKTNER